MKFYYDLNISESSKPSDILRYLRLGYTRLAFNRIIDVKEGCLLDEDKKQSKEEKTKLKSKLERRIAIPDFSFLINEEVKETALKLNTEVKLFSRLTLIASDHMQLSSFMREYGQLIKKYDVLACDARCSEVLNHMMEKVSFELLTFDLNSPVTILSHKIFKQCRDRNVAVEINLSAALTSNAGRMNSVKFIHDLGLYRCPSIITVTSGARSNLLIRNHLSLRCILSTMGLNDKILKEINNNADKAINKGLARKHTIYGSAAIIQLNKIPGVVSVQVTNKPDDLTNSPKKKKLKL